MLGRRRKHEQPRRHLTEQAELCCGPCDGLCVPLEFNEACPLVETTWPHHGSHLAIYRRRGEVDGKSLSAWIRLANDIGGPLVSKWDYVGEFMGEGS